jgi:23S rRNA U2552 (ribose-2'-O)-methylase RlmE/FtsJ
MWRLRYLTAWRMSNYSEACAAQAKRQPQTTNMETLFSEKPPWKHVEWVRSPFWATAPTLTWGPWIEKQNEEATRVKMTIEVLDREHKWELAKKMVNTYELVYTNGDERLPTPVCVYQPLSRSYFKMIEMLEVLQFYAQTAKNAQKLRTAHVAEGPGGFIQACIQQSEGRQKEVTATYAMTLKPTTSHVPGWKKATVFLFKHKQVKVLFGEDGTGDIYKVPNQQAFLTVANPGVHLFTADGGFDFSVDYTQQEQKVFHLLVCSIRVGLQVLRSGGSFVLKLFDCETEHTQALLWILGRHFDEWTLYKPAMTRPCNSERYFLGRGFRGLSPTARQILADLQGQSEAGQYPVLPETLWTQREKEFLDAHIRTSTALQILSIQTAIELAENPGIWKEKWVRQAIDRAYSWCEAFRMPTVQRR